MPGVNGVVTQLDNEPTSLGEYWHRIHTAHGERREPGCNLELIPTPIGMKDAEHSAQAEYGGAYMGPRSMPDHLKQPARLTSEEMQAGIERLKKRLGEVKAFIPGSVTDQHNTANITKMTAAIEDALVRTFGSDSVDYGRYKEAAYFGSYMYIGKVPIKDIQSSLERYRAGSIALLEQAIESLQERLLESEASATPDPVIQAKSITRRVFVVHGRDEGARESVARFLERLGFEAIILHEQASRGGTVIEKVEAHSDVGFAVVLLTPDDEGCVKGGTPTPRARQNVLLELGYFVGRLGRNRVCALRRGEVEIPSDFEGVVYVPLDDSGAWRQTLGKELEAAGFGIDWNKVMRP